MPRWRKALHLFLSLGTHYNCQTISSLLCSLPSWTRWERQLPRLCVFSVTRCACVMCFTWMSVCVCVSLSFSRGLRFLRWGVLLLLTRSASDDAHHMPTCVLCLQCEIGWNVVLSIQHLQLFVFELCWYLWFVLVYFFLNHRNDVKGLNRFIFRRNLELLFRNSGALMSVFSLCVIFQMNELFLTSE